MFVTNELARHGEDVDLIFQGAGVRWASEVVRPDHPAHAMYAAVADHVLGVCGGCADVFGATDEVRSSGLELVRQADIPGTSGVIDLSAYARDGGRVLSF